MPGVTRKAIGQWQRMTVAAKLAYLQFCRSVEFLTAGILIAGDQIFVVATSVKESNRANNHRACNENTKKGSQKPHPQVAPAIATRLSFRIWDRIMAIFVYIVQGRVPHLKASNDYKSVPFKTTRSNGHGVIVFALRRIDSRSHAVHNETANFQAHQDSA
jgi:hypothetical protein